MPRSVNGISLHQVSALSSSLSTEACGGPSISHRKSGASRFVVLLSKSKGSGSVASTKRRSSWEEGFMTVGWEKSVLYRDERSGNQGGSSRWVATSSGTGLLPNAVYTSMTRSQEDGSARYGFGVGDVVEFSRMWTVEIVQVMHLHLLPYDADSTATSLPPPLTVVPFAMPPNLETATIRCIPQAAHGIDTPTTSTSSEPSATNRRRSYDDVLCMLQALIASSSTSQMLPPPPTHLTFGTSPREDFS